MPGHEELKTLLETGGMVFGSDGEKIGTLGHINLDDRTGIPDFVSVHTGFLGSTESFVPLNEAVISNGNLYVNFPREIVMGAPEVDPAVALSIGDEERLYHYYSRAGVGILHTVADPDRGRATAPGEHTVHVVRERHVIRVSGVVHDDFAPGHPRLRKEAHPGSGDHRPASVEEAVLPRAYPAPGQDIDDVHPEDPRSSKGRIDHSGP